MAHRRDVDALVRRLAMTVAVLASLVWPVAAAPDQPCEVVPMPCTFEGLPFKITVIDPETRQPLADVRARGVSGLARPMARTAAPRGVWCRASTNRRG